MPLEPGTRFGVYEIRAAIGAGGMGEVYRAHDTVLGRDVAVKVLPESLATDVDRLARLEREARALAAFNHPNIAQVYGLEQSGPVRAIVMELVTGQDLAARLRSGPIAVDDAVSIARQITSALEAAHERGIVHRDLKPANVKVTDDGVTKVLDFGLAKAIKTERSDIDASEDPTVTSPAMTEAGVCPGSAKCAPREVVR